VLVRAFALEWIERLFGFPFGFAESRDALSESEVALLKREISKACVALRRSISNREHLRDVGRAPRFGPGVKFAPNYFGGYR
jgi:hypothetical protein